MKHFFGAIGVAGLVAGFLCVMGQGALAKGKNPVRPDRSRSIETQATVGECDPGVTPLPGFPSEEWTGQGNALHTGLFSDELCIAITGVSSPGSPLVLEVAGRGSLTAANGDVVFFEIENGLTNVDAGCMATATIVYVGGTGRFEQASGSADCVSVRSTPCGPSQATTCSGSISY